VKQKLGGGGGGGVEARDFIVSEGHGHPLVIRKIKKNINEKTFPNHLLVQINQFVMVISSKQT